MCRRSDAFESPRREYPKPKVEISWVVTLAQQPLASRWASMSLLFQQPGVALDRDFIEMRRVLTILVGGGLLLAVAGCSETFCPINDCGFTLGAPPAAELG